jgi:hypothetical protein
MSFPNIERFGDGDISDDMIAAAAKLFSENYGVWGPLAAEKMGAFAKQGKVRYVVLRTLKRFF